MNYIVTPKDQFICPSRLPLTWNWNCSIVVAGHILADLEYGVNYAETEHPLHGGHESALRPIRAQGNHRDARTWAHYYLAKKVHYHPRHSYWIALDLPLAHEGNLRSFNYFYFCIVCFGFGLRFRLSVARRENLKRSQVVPQLGLQGPSKRKHNKSM